MNDLSRRLYSMTVEEVRGYLSRRAHVGRKTVQSLLADPRSAVRLLGKARLSRLRAERRERRRLQRLGEHEQELYAQGVERVVGIDEAGRAPFAGPVVAAAVVLPPDSRIKQLDDSKRLDEPARNRLFGEIRARALDWAIGIASPAAIDALNIYQASVAAMRLAVSGLSDLEGFRFALLIDGRRIRDFPYPHQAIVDGDARCRSIAAASILAKVTRDRLMRSLHDSFPHYNFFSNKGYGTSEHLRGIRAHGLCTYHRRTFAPVWDLGEAGSPAFRLWQEEILHCEDYGQLRQIGEDLQPRQAVFLPQEFRTLLKLLRLASRRFEA